MMRMARLAMPQNTSTIVSNRMRRSALFLTAAAALSTRVDAFLPPIQRHSTIRLYGSSSSKNNDDNILTRAAKKVLPSWFQSEEEQKAALAKKQVKDNVKGGIQELLKDAPLPVRMMGGMVAPLLSSLASTVSESMAEQQRTIETVLEDAQAYMLGDDAALQALGEPLQVGAPFSQSSSTTIINGQKTVNLVIGFPVEGSCGSGMAQAQATDQGINRLTLQVNGGQQINVSLMKRGSASSSSRIDGKAERMFPSDDDDTIIEAEIIEKDVKR